MSRAGLTAAFETERALLAAIRALRDDGITRLDALAPLPVRGLSDALGLPGPGIRLPMLVAGVGGAAAAFGMQAYSAVWAYPILSGGRAFFSWPAFMFVTFEIGVLSAALAGFVAMAVRAGLTRLHHPDFALDGGERASDDRFLLLVGRDDPAFDPERLRRQLEPFGPVRIVEVRP